MVFACADRNWVQVGPVRRGAGSIPARFKISHTAKNQDLHLFVNVGAESQDHELGEPGDRLVQK
jgi:hypothetical protein